MKKKCVFVGFWAIIVLGLTACGSAFSMESVAASEPEIIVIKDEVVVPLAQQPVKEKELESEEESVVEEKRFVIKDITVEEMYVVLSSENVEAETADGRVDKSDFAANVHGIVVKMDEEINHLMNELGEPDSFVETVRNPRIGSDKTYTYKGIVISTNPKNGRDIVSTITYRGEEKTLSGIGIGSTRADIEAAYGIDYMIDPNYIIYMYGENATLSFRMNEEKCECIELSWK